MLKAPLIVTLSICVSVLLAESVTFTVKVAVPCVGELALTTPAVETLSPTALRLLCPLVTLQVHPPAPPLAASVCEYAVLAVPAGSVDVVIFRAGFAVVIEYDALVPVSP